MDYCRVIPTWIYNILFSSGCAPCARVHQTGGGDSDDNVGNVLFPCGSAPYDMVDETEFCLISDWLAVFRMCSAEHTGVLWTYFD